MKVISQLDPKYATLKFPGTNYSWSSYGCLCSCLCMLLDKEVFDFIAENPNGWTRDGDLKTDEVLQKYGYKLIRQSIKEGQPLPVRSERYIARTSFMAPKYPTHFYIVEPDHSIVDPGSNFNPKPVNRYENTTNEIRYLQRIGQLTLEQRVKKLEDKVFS